MRKLVTRILNKSIRKCSLLTRILFGVNVVNRDRIHWDFTTLLFKRVLKRQIKPGYKVLEIGTGPHAILSIYSAKRVECQITSGETNEHYIEDAKKTARINDVDIKIVKSDLFGDIEGSYNIIFWNSLYIPYEIGITYGMDNLCDFQTDWCGGEKGFESIALFLESAGGYLKDDGKLLLGFNNMYLKEESVAGLCESYGYDVEEIRHGFVNPSRIVIMAARGKNR